jgi:hypothetical protein
MCASIIGGVPQGDNRGERDLNRDLAGKMPPVQTSFEEVRKGWRALRTAKTRILNSEGRDITDGITDSMIDSSGGDFHKLMARLTNDSPTTARLFADAALVKQLPNDSSIYLEGLVVYGKSIPIIKDTTYLGMQEKDRLELAEFLYRPAEERQFPIHQKMMMLYPRGFNIAAGGIFEEASRIEDDAIRLMAMNLIESDSLERPTDKQIEKIWNERGWNKYLISGEAKLVDARIAPYNMPHSVENILTDLMAYLGTGDKGERSLDRITEAAREVLPHRKRLAEVGYFKQNTNEAERHIMLQTVLEGRPLF